MKFLVLLASLSTLTFSVSAQEHPGFIPPRLSQVSLENYNKGKYILENTYKSMQEHGDTVYADYWNIAVGYAYMDWDKNEILNLLKKSKAADGERFCTVVQRLKRESSSGKLQAVLGDDFRKLIAGCDRVGVPKPMPSSLKAKTNVRGLNDDLITRLEAMMLNDQKYRRENDLATNWDHWEKQKLLDIENQQLLENIFEKYGYPGKSIVGEKYKNHACLILEHADDLAFQEKWFPLIIEAMQKREIEKNVVRLLIDRIYWKKTGRQIFGSQFGVPMEEEKIIRQVQLKYGL